MPISNDINLVEQLEHYKKELQNELLSILSFWRQSTIDTAFGGFHGRLDNSNKAFKQAPKGSVLNGRILCAFSAAYNLTGNEDYLNTAERAFQYITDYFVD